MNRYIFTVIESEPIKIGDRVRKLGEHFGWGTIDDFFDPAIQDPEEVWVRWDSTPNKIKKCERRTLTRE